MCALRGGNSKSEPLVYGYDDLLGVFALQACLFWILRPVFTFSPGLKTATGTKEGRVIQPDSVNSHDRPEMFVTCAGVMTQSGNVSDGHGLQDIP